MPTLKISLIFGVLLIALTASNIVGATTYSNSSTSSIGPLGYPNSSNIGEVFTTGGGILTDWTFYHGPNGGINTKLVVAKWEGYQAVGPALYTSPDTYMTAGSGGAIAFTGISTMLASGNYIAYLTVSSNSNPGSSTPLYTSNSNGGLSGYSVYANTSGIDPMTLTYQNWTIVTSANPYLNYTVTINPVPEPETYIMMLAGLGLMGFVARRKQNTKVW